jgi:hypothetical protein
MMGPICPRLFGLTLDEFEEPRYQCTGHIKKRRPTEYLMLNCDMRGSGATVKRVDARLGSLRRLPVLERAQVQATS